MRGVVVGLSLEARAHINGVDRVCELRLSEVRLPVEVLIGVGEFGLSIAYARVGGSVSVI